MSLRITLNKARDIKVIGEAGDGISAIEKIKVHPPDIVLIDIDMPRLSGIGATRILRKEIPRLKIMGLPGLLCIESTRFMFFDK